MRNAATHKAVYLRRASERTPPQTLLAHPKICLIFFLHKDNTTHKNVSSKKPLKIIKTFPLWASRNRLWSRGSSEVMGEIWALTVTLAHTLRYSQTCWAFLPPPYHFSPVWYESTFELSFLGSENKHVMEYTLLLPLMSLRQHDNIWFLYISWFFSPHLKHLHVSHWHTVSRMWKVGREK